MKLLPLHPVGKKDSVAQSAYAKATADKVGRASRHLGFSVKIHSVGGPRFENARTTEKDIVDSVAQSVEQLTLNQRVPGSSPGGVTEGGA